MIIDTRGEKPFYEIGDWLDEHLKKTAFDCIAAQRAAVAGYDEAKRSRDVARAAVLPGALDRILSAGTDIHGISADPGISNVVAFNTKNLQNSVDSESIAELRRRLDNDVAAMVQRAFRKGKRMHVACSGHFWYPPGSYMGWHTNNRAPGWRVYLTHAVEPGQSFFRYRDPRTGEIVTSMDHDWDLRVFRVDPKAPLWHTVYSNTHRFSFGYIVIEKSLVRSFLGQAKSFMTHDHKRSPARDRASTRQDR